MKNHTNNVNFLCFILNSILSKLKSLHNFILHKIDGYIRKYDRTKYLALFHSNGNNHIIFHRVRCLIMLKINISDTYSHQYKEIKKNSDDGLP